MKSFHGRHNEVIEKPTVTVQVCSCSTGASSTLSSSVFVSVLEFLIKLQLHYWSVSIISIISSFFHCPVVCCFFFFQTDGCNNPISPSFSGPELQMFNSQHSRRFVTSAMCNSDPERPNRKGFSLHGLLQGFQICPLITHSALSLDSNPQILQVFAVFQE